LGAVPVGHLWYEARMSIERSNMSARDALARLREGNGRYSSNVRSVDSMLSHGRRGDLAVQSPFAIVLGCSDSRAPAEIVFDQGLGDLFVIRVAGNIVASSQVGSVEFAAERFGTRLVVVMGHTGCGAIEAAIESITSENTVSRNQLSIVSRVRPSIESLAATELARDPVRLRREAVRANVRASVNHLRHGSEVIERLAEKDGLVVVGSELDLTTGEVTFFNGELG
jgi:carbonic anhydrase